MTSPQISAAELGRWRAPVGAAVITVGQVDTAKGFLGSELWSGVRRWCIDPDEDDTWVEGGATFNGHVVGSSWGTPVTFRAESLLPGFGERWAMGAHGSAACWVADRENHQLFAYPDFFGGCSLFIAELPGGTALSTSLRQLELFAQAVGTPLARSAEFQAERIMLGNGGLWPTSFTHVRRLDHMSFVRISGTQVSELAYRAGDQMLQSSASIEEILSAIQADIRANVRAIAAAAAEHRVGHLTGGFDSRLVLSAILSEGLQDRFLFFTSGAVGATDRIIADGLARTYHLTRTADAGLSPAPARNVRDRFLGPMRASAGILGAGVTGREPGVPIVTAGGGYGELLRSFFKQRTATYSRASTPQEVMARLWPTASSSRICRPAFAAELAERLSERLAQGASRGVPEHYDLDFFYLSIRNRYHIGMNAYLWSGVGTRLDPLYSPHLLSLGMRARLEDRASNVHGFDLMDRFSPRLRHHPFDSDRYDAHARTQRPPRLEPLSTDGSIRWGTIPQRRRPVAPLVVSTPAERDALVRRANAMGINFWQLQWLPVARQALRRALRETADGNIDSVLNMGYIDHLARGEVRAKSEIRDVYTCLEALLWLSS